MADVNNGQGTCLNIGCADSVADGWINLDSSPTLRIAAIPVAGKLLVRALDRPTRFDSAVYGDIVRGLKLPPGSCDLVFASHVLEHLSMPDFETALENIHTYLRPGGILRVLVPDLRDYIESYRRDAGDDATASEAAPTFMTMSGLGCEGTRRSIGARLREALSNSRHQTMWDEPSLSAALARHGFTNIRSCRYGGWGDERFAAVELEIRHDRSICVEATK
jgi:SAM-dependent methyltransferase